MNMDLSSMRIFCGWMLNSLQILSVSALGWVREESLKQEQIVLERSARFNLDPERGDKGDR